MLLWLPLTMVAQEKKSCFDSATQEKACFDDDWRFHLGYAGDMQRDFEHGTEYFTYYTKAKSNNGSKAPVAPAFDDSGWQKVTLPHDWVVDLPYAGEASHSHGYKQVGWRYPQNSVGWYRRTFYVPEEDRGKQLWVEFEGIFRQSQVFCNGAYLGSQLSGYTSDTYNLSPYIEYGKENVITVRVDASTEEGWYYEGAGIYRHAYLHRAGKVAMKPYSLCITGRGEVTFETVCTGDEKLVSSRVTLLDAAGQVVPEARHRWSLEDPYLYTARVELLYDGQPSATYEQRFGVRDIEFSAEQGFLLNGKRVELKGCDLHLDAAGVGVAVPDALWRYRLEQLKKWGFNAIRCSHNPATPAMLDACDEMGFLVIDENRQFGANREQMDQLTNMIQRDRNHPSVILWSMGNEEWAVEYDEHGKAIATELVRLAHKLDSTRPTTYGACSGPMPNKAVDVFGFNYVVQNNIKGLRDELPGHTGVGTEETSGCGTRGKYVTNDKEGWMLNLNRQGVDDAPMGGEPRPSEGYRLTSDGKVLNVIERGWKYYDEHQNMGGLFYWTGFDYRGEPNPMTWPATGSQFGILDYCGFPKDEAYYLKSMWTDEPVLYLSPHWNAPVAEGQDIEVWAYTNCTEVTLSVNGQKLTTKQVPKNGHVAWRTTYKPGKLEATGAFNGRTIRTVVATTGEGNTLRLTPSKKQLKADGHDVIVVDMEVLDKKGQFVPNADKALTVSLSGATLLGWGNGNPGYKEVERPQGDAMQSTTTTDFPIKTFSGCAQLLIRSIKGHKGDVNLSIKGLPGGEQKMKLVCE